MRPAQVVAELMQISAEQRSMAVQQLQRFSANRQSAVDLTKWVLNPKPFTFHHWCLPASVARCDYLVKDVRLCATCAGW